MEGLLMDVECYPNYFCVTFEDIQTHKQYFFEISPDQDIDQTNLLCTYYRSVNNRSQNMITFNGVHYDCPILNFIILNQENLSLLEGRAKTLFIKDFSDTIINSEIWWRSDVLKPYKYNQDWNDIDLMLYWSKMLRKTKKISLKSLGIQLHYPTVQELPYPHDRNIPTSGIPKLQHYNRVHDITILRYLIEKTFKINGQDTTFDDRLQLRLDAIQEYGLYRSCVHWDDVKLGSSILINSYAKSKKIPVKELPKPTYKTGDPIKIASLISDKVMFHTKDFQEKLELLRGMTVYDTKSIAIQWQLGDVIYDFGSGGLHNRVKTGTIEAPSGYIYLDWDVASEYPSLVSVLNISPEHLPGFGEMINEKLNRRLYLKSIGKGKTPEANMIKLALNGGIGKLNEEHSEYRDPRAFLKVTLNGQLYLLMLCEQLHLNGCIIDMANTDGTSFFAPKSLDVKRIWREWETLTGLVLEEERLDKVWRTGINEYLCRFENGYLKAKGSSFIRTPDLGNSCDNLIVPKAVVAFLTEGISLKDTIKNPEAHILDFCAAPKSSRKYSIYYGKEMLPQRLNRFYASKQGQILTKREVPTRPLAIAGYKGVAVRLLNEWNPELPEVKHYPVNFDYYIKQAQSIIDVCCPQEPLTLF